jgi:hypothetical protein
MGCYRPAPKRRLTPLGSSGVSRLTILVPLLAAPDMATRRTAAACRTVEQPPRVRYPDPHAGVAREERSP